MAEVRDTLRHSGGRRRSEPINDHAAAIDAIIADLATLKAGVNALDTAMDALVAKMNLDAGITDANYAGAAAAGTIGTLTAAALDGDTVD